MGEKHQPLGQRLRKAWKKTRKRWRARSRTLRHFLVYLLTNGVRRSMVCLSPRTARKCGAAMGGIAYKLAAKERHKMLRHLELAYGDLMDDSARRALAKQVLVNAGMSLAEWCFLSLGRAEDLLKTIRFEGAEHVEKTLAENRGIVFVTAHFGNWELMAPLMAHRVPGREVGVVARNLDNRRLDNLVVETRKIHGVRVFPRGGSGSEYVRFLRKGGALAVLGDIDTRKGGGIFVNFFGHPARTPDGIARLARLGRAAVMPVFIQRDPENPAQHTIRVEPAIPEPQNASEETFILEITQGFTSAIEQAIRRRPDQWMWMHRRWRHRPPEADAAPDKKEVSLEAKA